MPVKPSQDDFKPFLGRCRIALAPDDYQTVKWLVEAQVAYRMASRRRQAKYDRKKREMAQKQGAA